MRAVAGSTPRAGTWIATRRQPRRDAAPAVRLAHAHAARASAAARPPRAARRSLRADEDVPDHVARAVERRASARAPIGLHRDEPRRRRVHVQPHEPRERRGGPSGGARRRCPRAARRPTPSARCAGARRRRIGSVRLERGQRSRAQDGGRRARCRREARAYAQHNQCEQRAHAATKHGHGGVRIRANRLAQTAAVESSTISCASQGAAI